jgi:hypothetical protein
VTPETIQVQLEKQAPLQRRIVRKVLRGKSIRHTQFNTHARRWQEKWPLSNTSLLLYKSNCVEVGGAIHAFHFPILYE